MSCVLGIDTSCYTTSIALMDTNNNLLLDERIILPVKEGGCGLRQSEMVFLHNKNLPILFEKASEVLKNTPIKAIGVSVFPRRIENSYMPAFTVGHGFAKVIAMTNNIEIYELSHQENHILAGMWSTDFSKNGKFLVGHLSGGTTEFLLVESIYNKDNGIELKIQLLGGSKDIQAGQLIDRIGVNLGLPFPAGVHLEKLASSVTDFAEQIPVSIDGFDLSFSGPETFIKKLINKGVSAEKIAASTQFIIAKSLEKVFINIINKLEVSDILLVGGVASNSYIRSYVKYKLYEYFGEENIKLHIPEAKYSSDNAVGAAYYALEKYRNK